MFRLVAFSLPVAILPLLAVQLVETLIHQSLLPEIAIHMNRASEGEVSALPAPAAPRAVPRPRFAAETVAMDLPLNLRF